MSGSEDYSEWGRAKSCKYRGKMGIDVAICLDLRFMVIARRSLEETPATFVAEEDYEFMRLTPALKSYISL